MMYIKSQYTGQVMPTDSLPQFGGWEVVSRATFVEWCEKHNFKPEELEKNF